jgi:hypothetical protein
VEFPKDTIDLTKVPSVQLAGRGGREQELRTLLPGWTRVNAPLHDYEIVHLGHVIRLEVKKQSDLQWFDSGKYYHLNEQDRRIYMLFLLHQNGLIDTVAVTLLGSLIDWLTQHRASDGWNPEVVRLGADFKSRYPSLQFKAPVHVRKTLAAAPSLFQVLYCQASPHPR